MTVSPPKIDPRAAAEIVATLVGKAQSGSVAPGLLEKYTTSPGDPYPFEAWREYDANAQPVGASAALIGIFARLAELAIQRLNQVPDKNFRAFLDLVGAAQLPPAPARVPLTFSLVAGRLDGAPVPAGTKVAAQPQPGDAAPVVFEVERPLVVSAVQLASLLTLDPERDTLADWTGRAPAAISVFQGEQTASRTFYVGDSQLLAHARIHRIRLAVTLAAEPLADARRIQWERWDGERWVLFVPASDTTRSPSNPESLTQSGVVEFNSPTSSGLLESIVDTRSSRWIRARLLTPVTGSSRTQTNMVRAAQLPSIANLMLAVDLERLPSDGLVADAGFINTTPLDPSQGFLPFGDKPKAFDVLYIASREAFAKDPNTVAGSDRVLLDVQLANSHLVPGPSSVRPSPDVTLAWEAWQGSQWVEVGRSVAPSWLSLIEVEPTPPIVTAPSVTLQGTVRPGTSLTVAEIPLSGNPQELPVAVATDGRFAHRAALTAGSKVFRFSATHEGQNKRAWAAVFLASPSAPDVAVSVSVPEVPAATDSVTLTVRVVVTGNLTTAASVSVTNATTGVTSPAAPISLVPGANIPVQVTLGLALGRNELLAEVKQTAPVARLAAAVTTVGLRQVAPAVNAAGFSDGTFGLTQSGTVTLRLPVGNGPTVVNGQENLWLRVRLLRGGYGQDALYALKDATDPAQGFTLIPASFRPPAVSKLNVGYALTERRVPETTLTYGRLTFEDMTSAVGRSVFQPFVYLADPERPALYLGFSLPPRQTVFPNSSISAYAMPTELQYGERSAPLSPDVSRRADSVGALVVHRFEVANPSARARTYGVTLLGHTWQATIAAVPPGALVDGVLTVPAFGVVPLDVAVTIVSAISGESDRGFLQLTDTAGVAYGASFLSAAGLLPSPEPPRLAWQYWNGSRFAKLTVRDDTRAFAVPGVIQYLAPTDFAPSSRFGLQRYWVRVLWDEGEFSSWPRLRHLLINTTSAVQSTTVANEILGSSNGAKDQAFRTTRAPVLDGQRLEVREQEMPTAEEQRTLDREEGSDAILIIPDASGRPREIWVRWHEVSDFYGSGPRDRHYVMDHLSGEVRFGNGVRGRIPAVGPSNLRLRPYRVGGGSTGNRAAGTVTQLKTSVPYVDKVTNPVAATGGAEAETLDDLFERVPRTLRHRDRSVTPEDYEDLAQLATPEVARTLAVPLRDLAGDPLGREPSYGTVSLIVVPRTRDSKPVPSLELLERVRRYLAERTPAAAALAVVGPLYLRVDVRTEVAVASLDDASAVQTVIEAELAAFLHPLTGGLDGKGWDFGRAPHRSDIIARIESVPGVDHLVFLEVTETEEPRGAAETGRFLVHSGTHTITLAFDET